MARLVLVHGAFSGAWCWDRALPALRALGHEVQALDLPGSGADTTPASEVTLESYGQRICEALADGPPAVLFGHSMGGMAITQAAARMPERITALVYLAAFLPEHGESLLELTHRPEAAGDQIQANMVLDGDPPVTATLPDAAARTAVYGCCSDEVADWALSFRRPQPTAPMAQPLQVPSEHAEAFAALPRRYVTCLQDLCIRPAMQRFMFERADAEPVIEIDTDHAPFLSRTEETVAALDRMATL